MTGKRKATLQDYIKRGKTNLSKERFSKAIANFDRAIKLDPTCDEAYFLRGRAYEESGKSSAALDDYNKALELDPDFAHAYYHRARMYEILGEHEKALKDCDKCATLEPKDKFAALFNKGLIYSATERPDEALKMFEETVELNPKFVPAILEKVRLNVQKGHFEKALEDSDKAIEIAPKYAFCYMYKGNVYGWMGKHNKALENYDKAIQLDPTESLFYLNKAIQYRLRQQPDKALEAFAEAIKVDPKKEQAYLQIGLTYEGMRKFDKALEVYEKATELFPKHSHLQVHKGIAYGNLGSLENAVQCFNQAITTNPKETMAYLNRGICYYNLNEFDLALMDINSALKLDPNLERAYFFKGKSLCHLADEKKPFKERKTYESDIVDCFRKVIKVTEDSNLKKIAKWWVDFSKRYCSASGDSRKRLRIFAELYEATLRGGLFSRVMDEEDRFNKFMSLSKTVDKSECFFDVLRRWNSFTPIIPSKSGSKLGGGYFLVWDGCGTVIDPGYNYVENFMKSRFCLGDIENIIITHAHDDHTADFEPILSLFSKVGNHKTLNLLMNLGSSVKFSNLISRNESIIHNVQILNTHQTYQLSPNVCLKATPAWHKDVLTSTTTKGLIFEMRRGSKTFRIGITSDTKLYSGNGKDQDNLYHYFENIDVLVVHIGSIHENEFQLTADNFEAHRYEGEHLGVRGIVNMIFQCRPKLAIISEFGEELRALRTDIAQEIDKVFENYDSSGNSRVVPGDVGLRIIFKDSIGVRCELCGKTIDLNDLDYSETLINDKIAYHCKSHERKEVVGKFEEEEKRELRVRAESVGCTLELTPPVVHFPEIRE